MRLAALLVLAAAPGLAGELVCCGWDEVFILDVTGAEARKVWSWRAAERPEIPERLRGRFKTTDDCKPVDGGRRILVTSSGGGVALVERATKKAVFWAFVGNAHSAEMLPRGRVVVAGSTHKEGNCLALFDVARPEKRLFTDALHSGHGVVWDPKREILWASGYDELRAYRLEAWETAAPRLRRAKTFRFPDAPKASGHDLAAVPGSSDLVATTHGHVFLFDREKRTFRKHPRLGDRPRVKSVAIHPRSGRVAYVQAEGKNWWSPRVRWLAPAGELRLPDRKLYKVRWIP